LKNKNEVQESRKNVFLKFVGQLFVNLLPVLFKACLQGICNAFFCVEQAELIFKVRGELSIIVLTKLTVQNIHSSL